MTDLEKHDARFHPEGYKEWQSCKYRDALRRGDDADKLEAAEKAEGDANAAMQKYIDRYNAIGVLMMAQPLASEPYEKVLAEYGIKKGTKGFDAAMDAIEDAQEWFDANNDGDDLTSYRMKVLDLDAAFRNLQSPPPASQSNGQKAPVTKPPSAGKAARLRKSAQPPVEDYEDLVAIRNQLEPVARLLNGRAGNLAALQSSSRFQSLQNISRNSSIGPRLDELAGSSDKDISSAAQKLKSVFDNIVKSAKSNWNNPAGMVPPASSLPEIPEED